MNQYPRNVSFRPIQAWPGAHTANRKRSPFRATWRATMDLLDHELWNLGPGRYPDAVLELALRERDIRVSDGMPRADARTQHPGVILDIESVKGPLRFPCDRFDTWQDNLRAIALALEALRKVDRYGVTQRGEQYTGWRAIEATSNAAPFTDTASAVRWIRDYASLPTASLAAVVRAARRQAHPDRNSGDRTEYDLVDAAVQLLEREGLL